MHLSTYQFFIFVPAKQPLCGTLLRRTLVPHSFNWTFIMLQKIVELAGIYFDQLLVRQFK
jgi:hypothetical protein